MPSIEISKTFKHIFTSPSSVDREAKATRSGNARIHGMSSVTPASIAYVTANSRPISKDSVLAKIRAKRAAAKIAALQNSNNV